VTHDRLKLCNLDRKKFSEHLPRLAIGGGEQPQSEPEVALDNLGGQQVEAQPLEIMADKKVKGKTQYLVRFDDGADYLVDGLQILQITDDLMVAGTCLCLSRLVKRP